MPYGFNIVDTITHLKIEPPHPCDPKPPCNPFYQEGGCDPPYICLEKIKNPAFENEITRCMEGATMNVKKCKNTEPPHPCDSLPPCSEIKKKKLKSKPVCIEPTLALEKIKNPDNTRKLAEPCDPYR